MSKVIKLCLKWVIFIAWKLYLNKTDFKIEKNERLPKYVLQRKWLKTERKHMSENYLVYESKGFRKMCGMCNMKQEHMFSIKTVESHRNSGWDEKLIECDKEVPWGCSG